MIRRMRTEDFLTEPELKALLEAARGRPHKNAPRDHALLAVLGITGIRPGEAALLRVADLYLKGHKPWMRIHRLKTRKEGGRLDDVPLTRTLAGMIKREVRRRRLTTADRLFPMTVRSMEYLFAEYARRAALTPRRRLYCLRHTALTRAWWRSRDLVLVQQLAGHASIGTTAIYMHTNPDLTREVLERTGAGL